ncbi:MULTISPECIES: SRPBCC family protein [unclassified Gordonia (in: high G+C Gram-positive bacteria)]|uniref:SRPBCC family protein n=1 Tax=unclassified Gordonia (in: high G+C Gram-positive bacteria) TaxID=2657482 RepID=UPI001FFE5D13|nr:SRPBCC family protein [Gordonia sp. PP30]UQE74793.1 SRPBCC family protein [Gordonia sp. PP30]
MPAELIEESIDIDGTPEQVWAVVSDLARMGEWSPQCKKMLVLGGPVKAGTRTFNLNRRGPLFWPTSAKVVIFEPNKAIGWKITENRTVWSYTITEREGGVTLTESRKAADGKTTALSGFLVDKAFGGNDGFEAELQTGMRETLGKVKRAVEN